MTECKRQLAEAVIQQCRALAQHHGHAWDHDVDAQCRRHAEEVLTDRRSLEDRDDALPGWAREPLARLLRAVLLSL